MEIFVVDGSKRNFADEIIARAIDKHKLFVVTYGFGVRQVQRLVSQFDAVVMVTDDSHAQINKSAYKAVVALAETLPHFSVKFIKNHAKLAIIDDAVVIFTSANLAANRRMELYVVGDIAEFSGVERLNELICDPDKVFEDVVSRDNFDFMDLSV